MSKEILNFVLVCVASVMSIIMFGCSLNCHNCTCSDSMQEYRHRIMTAKDFEELSINCDDMSECVVKKGKFCRKCVRRVFGDPIAEMDISLLYDVKTADGNVYYVSFNFIQSDYCESVHAELISSSSE